MRSTTMKLGTVMLSAGLLVGLTAGPVGAATGTVLPASSDAAVPTVAGWKKALLTEKQVTGLADFVPGTVTQPFSYNTAVGYAKTWVGECEETGSLTAAGVEIDKMPAAGWKASAQGFANGFGYTIVRLDSTTMTGWKLEGNGTKSYAVLRNAGSFAVAAVYTVPVAEADDAYSYGVASKLAAAQKKKLNAAGYGR
jgi:hypothetical protein